MSLNWKWNCQVIRLGTLSLQKNFTIFIQMSWKNRNQNNIIPFKKGVENKQKIEAEDRIKMIVGSIDVKMQQPYWDALVFDDQELQLLSNFGETIKFPHDNTAVRALSILATYILKKEAEEDLF